MTYAHRPKSVAPNTIATLDSMSQIVETLISKKQRPQSLTLESKKVVISDVHGDLDRFDIALEIVAANDWPWPCARIDVGSSRQEPGLEHKRLVPIDLAEGFEDTFGETVSELIHRRIFEERSGFGTWGVQIEPVPPTQIKSVFARGLADFIRERWKSLRNTPDDSGGHSPPETAVAVTTTIDKQTVLFSKGFFLRADPRSC
jgi:hypothetical protein